MTDIELEAYKDDIHITIDVGYDTGTVSGFLSEAVTQAATQVEKYMCNTNADEFYDIAEVFELLAERIRDQYRVWKTKGLIK